MIMKSILDGRPRLENEVGKIAEVAGYLWQKGWAERNGGNITVNITAFIDDEIKALPAISDIKEIGATLPALKGQFLLQGNGTTHARPCSLADGERKRHSCARRLQ